MNQGKAAFAPHAGDGKLREVGSSRRQRANPALASNRR